MVKFYMKKIVDKKDQIFQGENPSPYNFSES